MCLYIQSSKSMSIISVFHFFHSVAYLVKYIFIKYKLVVFFFSLVWMSFRTFPCFLKAYYSQSTIHTGWFADFYFKYWNMCSYLLCYMCSYFKYWNVILYEDNTNQRAKFSNSVEINNATKDERTKLRDICTLIKDIYIGLVWPSFPFVKMLC